MSYVDLHLHTDQSDGSDPPRRVVGRAALLGITALAITDHDTVSGVKQAGRVAEAAGIEFLTGAEISAGLEGYEVHILGLGIALDYPPLLSGLEELQTARNVRAANIIVRLKEAGINIDAKCVLARARGGVVGRMHVACELLAMGVTQEVQEGFNRYLNHGRPAYVPKTLMPAAEAIDLIHGAGGMAFVAHPGLRKKTHMLLPRLLELPFDGIEAYHTGHSPGRTGQYLEVAKDRGLLVTGGSDCHGMIKGPPEMGKVKTPYACFARIKQALAARA